MKAKTLAVAISFAALLLGACAAEDELVPVGGGGQPAPRLVKAENALEADSSVARDAVVGVDTITLPAAGHESLLTELKPGMTYFGDRAPGAPESNPLGFLVKIVSVGQEGDRIVIRTAEASMQDAFSEAVFDVDLPDDTQGTSFAPQSEGLQLLDTNGFSGSVPIVVPFSRLFQGQTAPGSLTADGKFSITGGIALTLSTRGSFRYASRGSLSVPDLAVVLDGGANFEISACAKIEGKLRAGKQAHDGLIAFDGQARTQSINLPLPEVAITVRAGPVPLTIMWKPEIFCGIEYARSASAAYQYKNNYRMRTRFGLASGAPYGTGEFTSTGGNQRWEFAMQGGVKLKCEVKLKGVFYLFNRIGAYALIGPGVELGVSGTFKLSGGQGPQTQTQNQVQGCAAFDAVVDSKYGLEAALGFLGNYKREYPLGTPFLLSLPFPLSRCAQNYTPVDSCAGKENGKAFCSSIDSRDSFSCNNNVSAGGNSCAIGQFCQSEGGSMGGAAIMEGTTAQCGTNPPRPADLSLSFCPSAVEALPRETE